MNCPTCGMIAGQCVHESEGLVTHIGVAPSKVHSTPTRPEPAAASPAAPVSSAAARGGADGKFAHFQKRIVSAERAACLIGYGDAIGFGHLHFSVVAPSVEELRAAWLMLADADPRVKPLREDQIQHVGILSAAAVKDLQR